MTTVLVTHDQEEALSLADAVAVLRDGRIIQQGAPTELYERPADERLARFLGAVNVIDARFEHGAARTALGTLELRGEPLPAGGASAGAVMVRPEQLDVQVYEEGAGAGAEGLRGRVEQCRYYGHDALLHIRPERPAGAGQGADAAQPQDVEHPQDAGLLLARVHGERALPIGARVAVTAHGPVTTLR